jgi:colanic acid/amylovoran biosynthesis glycosyltransferase
MKKVLLVMHNYPSNSPFLLNKLIYLNKYFNIKLLVWDKKKHSDNSVYFALHSNSILNLLFEFFKAFKTFIHNPFLSFSFLKELGLKKFIKGHYFIRCHFDIIHFEFGTLAEEWVCLKTIINCKMISSFRGYDLNYYKLNNSNTYTDVWSKIDAFHFLGKDLYKRAITRGYDGLKPNYFISPAIDLELFTPLDIKEYFTGNILKIVSVGRLVWKKGYEYGLNAIKLLKEKNFNIHYTIIGEGDYRQAIEFCIHELNLTENVFLTGSITQMEIKNILSSSDLFLHSAVSEGYSNAVIEAQAMKLPVICTKSDGLQENIEEGITGFSVSIYDSQSLASKIEYFLKHPNFLKDFGDAGAIRARKFYNLNDQISSFVFLYNKLIS